MENETHRESKAGEKPREQGTSSSEVNDQAKLEEQAKALSEKQEALDKGSPEKESEKKSGEGKESDKTEDPGSVARITAKGALSGF